MASTSRRLTEVDIVTELLTSIESDSEFDESEDLDYQEVSPNDSEDSSSDEEAEHPPRKRSRPISTSVLSGTDSNWNSGDFVPTLFPFDDSFSGIKPAVV